MDGGAVSGTGTVPVGASVVIPAHDEARVIAGSLRALLSDGRLQGVTLVVACNGCTDGTAAVAERTLAELAFPGAVLDLPEPSKVAAIRAAERLCPPGPRLYLDADVGCAGSTALELLRAVDRGGASVAVPARLLALDHAGALATAYYRYWESLPWVQRQLSGRGAYALSAGLRASFDEFPDVHADDRWATTRAPAAEAVVVAGAVTVRPPGAIADVVRVRSRIYAGNRDPGVPQHDAGGGRRAGVLVAGLRRPGRWPGLVVFSGVSVVAKLLARRRAAGRSWGRDAARGGRAAGG